MAEVIKIGSQDESKITAFGDESKYNDTNAFAYIILENIKIDWARNTLFNIKEKYNIPENIPLHLKFINDGRYKKENNLAHLTENKVLELINEIIEEMNKISFLIKGAYYNGILPKDRDYGDGFKIKWSDKGMQSILATFSLIPLNLKKYSYEDLKIIVSRDSSVISFLGDKRRQTNRWANGFSSIGAPEGYTYKFDPIIKSNSDDILLQFADIIVYSISHAFDIEKMKLSYREILYKANNIDIKPYNIKLL
jgi:hypothetical protein